MKIINQWTDRQRGIALLLAAPILVPLLLTLIFALYGWAGCAWHFALNSWF